MGGGIKALMPLAGKSLLQHVIDRVSPQVAELFLSVETPAPEFDRFGLEQVPDPKPGSNGPLGGLLASLERATTADCCDWLLLAPCDAPFLPRDLVARLLSEARQEDSGEVRVIVPRAEGHLQPTFAVWHVSTREAVQSALSKRGGAGLLDVLRQLPHRVVDWPATNPPAFFNVNTRADLDQAADWLQSATTTPSR